MLPLPMMSWISPYKNPIFTYVQGPGPSMFKLVHYETRTVRKRVIGIELKCLLVVLYIALKVVSQGY